jgi:hypothetical protein
VNGKIINAFGRKEGDPLPGSEPDTDAPKVCGRTVALLEAYLKMAQAGQLRGVAIAGLSGGFPAFSVVGSNDHDARDMAMLNLAIDEMKDIVRDAVFGDANITDLEDEE